MFSIFKQLPSAVWRSNPPVQDGGDGTLPRPGFPADSKGRWIVPAICVVLVLITLAVYGQTVWFDFVNLDDNVYVYDNPLIKAGLTLKGIATALAGGGPDTWDWVPLTTVSHMADWQFYGEDAGGHHLTNVLLHAASVVLLFLALRQMSGAVWRSGFVAAVFAVHPLHVESVAWVSERKDVLSGLFFMLTLLAYVRYVRSQSLKGYLMVALVFALGLMSKAMLVTAPFVLLLLDYWPLNRFASAPSAAAAGASGGWFKTLSVPARLIVEKIPLLGLSTVCGVLTLLVDKSSMQTVEHASSLLLRVEIALTSCIAYIWQMLYPVGLAAYYPRPLEDLPLWKVAGAFMVLAMVSLWVLHGRKKRPWLVTGWLWYVGMLAPAIGQFQADHFTYLPQIGLYVMVGWLAAELCAGWRNRGLILGGLAAILVGVLIVMARQQASYWKNSESLCRHAITITENNPVLYDNLGCALAIDGRFDEAIDQFDKALALWPDKAELHDNLGSVFARQGHSDEAISQFQKAINDDSNFVSAYDNLGDAMNKKGRLDEAVIQFQKALSLNPDDGGTHNKLGNLLDRLGRFDEAIAQYQQAIKLDPSFADAYNNLGVTLGHKGLLDKAVQELQEALKLDPGSEDIRYNLGNALVRTGQLDEAAAQFQAALKLKPDDPATHNNLGTVLYRTKHLDEAIAQFQQALKLKPDFTEARQNLDTALRVKDALSKQQPPQPVSRTMH